VLRTNNIDHQRTADYAAFASALAGRQSKAASLRDVAIAPAILLIGGDPTVEHPLLAWTLRTNVRLNKARLYIANTAKIKLTRQARATLELPADGYRNLPELLDADTDFAKAVRAEESLLVIMGEEIRGAQIEALVGWGLGRGDVRFACLGDRANSRGAADMGLLPDLLPGYVQVNSPGAFAAEYPGLPSNPGKTEPEMFAAAAKGELGALLIVGANPIARLGVAGEALKNTFVIVQDIFLNETAALADVVFPAASLYEKSGTITNTFGDVQLARKAADRAGVKPDFEILVRLAGSMGVDVKALVPFGKLGVTADLGQSRGAQAGEADRHAVWLAANGLEMKTSPFDPLAVLDEIERLVPAYKLDRLNLFGGSDVPTEPGATMGFVPVSALTAPNLVVPAHDGLFTSGTLGRYSPALKELQQHQSPALAETAAD
jgi:NADH-quinone oxidoreductase subunit G